MNSALAALVVGCFGVRGGDPESTDFVYTSSGVDSTDVSDTDGKTLVLRSRRRRCLPAGLSREEHGMLLSGRCAVPRGCAIGVTCAAFRCCSANPWG